MSTPPKRHASSCPVVDKRATKVIKACINKYFGKKHSIHLDIAKVISTFSHASVLQWGSVFEDNKCNFVIVERVKSPFYARVTFVPPFHIMPMMLGRFYAPDWSRASDFHVKKIFRPFSSRPYIKRRGAKYMMQKYNFGSG